MLQSEKIIENYYNRIKELNDANRKLAAEIAQHKRDLTAANEQYTELVKEGKDDQADDLIEDIEALEQSIKKKSKRLDTKKSLEEGAQLEEAYKALAHVPNIKNEFADDVAESNERLKTLLIDVNKELEHRKTVNEDYSDVYMDFVRIDDMAKPEDKEKRKEYHRRRGVQLYSTAPSLVSDNVDLSLSVKAKLKQLGVNE